MIRNSIILLAILLLLSSCSTEQPALSIAEQHTPDFRDDSDSAEKESTEKPDEKIVYTPSAEMTAKETISAYFEQLYLSYINLQTIDISAILDMSQRQNSNFLIWHENLITRRKLLFENNLCYVEREQFPYTINYTDSPEDERMDFWQQRDSIDDDVDIILHFTLNGEESQAYPPIMAMNSEHTIFLRQIDGVWKINFHYFPGSIRKFVRNNNLAILPEDVVLQNLLEEFGTNPPIEEPEIPPNAVLYNPDDAVNYALEHTESPNDNFYHVGDWSGNCANFVSQCIWGGLVHGETQNPYLMENMTGKWYAGSGGGSPAWENVDHFWNYITSQQNLLGLVVESVNAMKNGDILQTKTAESADDDADSDDGQTEDYSHSLILVDRDTMKFAQNTPGCFVYYSDLVNVDTRMIRPLGIIPD